jgi:hypothetical protein
MSALNETTTVIAPVVDKVVKEKKPSLPAKYAKFMQFGFFFISSMKDAGAIDDASAATLLDRLCTFSSVEQQQEFYQVWLDSAKESNKAMRKAIAAAKKAALPPKTKKPRAKKTDSPSSEEKTKKPRAKKSDKTNDLVDQLSALALNPSEPAEPSPTEPTPSTEVSASIPAKKPRAKKTKVLDTPTTVENATVDAQVVALAKPSKKSSKKDKDLVPSHPTPVLAVPVPVQKDNIEDPEEDLDVRDFVFHGKQYLIDDSTGNIFNIDTHEHIGVYNTETQNITFV